MINSFKNPAIMRILRTTERHGAGWREQNFIPHDEAAGLKKPSEINTLWPFGREKKEFTNGLSITAKKKQT